MANTIQIKRSSTASDTPSASDLSVGELAVNTADAKLFTKHTDGTVKELAGGGGSGISAVVDDTSPQLGGNLDSNDKNILLGDSTSDNSFANRIKLGAGNDLQLFHSGNASFISDTGTGNLFITGSNAIAFNSGDYGETYATFNDDGAVTLRHDDSIKFSTTSTGATVTGVLTSDGLDLGDSEPIRLGASQDLQLFHDGNSSLIDDTGTGSLFIRSSQVNIQNDPSLSPRENMATFVQNGAVTLMYDGSTRINTSSTGATITGGLTANVTGDGTEVLRLGTERPWAFLQRSTGATSSLSFRSTVDSKTFDIENEDGGLVARFIANNTTGLVSLYYGGSQRFITTSEGAQINSNLLVTSTDSGATEDPTLDLYRNSSSPADNDVLGHIVFNGENDAGEKIQYAEIESRIIDASDGSEDGRLVFSAMLNGTNTNYYSPSFGSNIFFRDVFLSQSRNIIFEGATDDVHETTLTVTDPTSDNTIQLPDSSGTVLLDTGNQTITGDLTLTSTDDDGALLKLVSNDPDDVADFGIEGQIQFFAENDASESLQYYGMQLRTADVTDGTEDGWLYFNSIANGTFTNANALGSDGTFYMLGNGNASNAVIKWFQTKGTSNSVSLAVATPSADRTITLPDATGTVLTTGNSDTPTTTTSSGDADFVLVDDGGTMKKITPTNLGIGGGGGGITVEEEGSALSTTATTLNFTGNGVTASGTGATKTIAVNGNEVLISSGTVSNVASIDFDSSVITGFEQYRVVLYNVTPATDTRELRMRLGTSNTAITSSIYQSALFQYGMRTDGSQRSSAVATANNTFLYLTAPTNDMGNNTGENCYAEVLLPNPNSTSGYKHVVSRVSNFSYFPAIMGQRISAMAIREQSAINFITFFAESGNIATASFRLYGIS